MRLSRCGWKVCKRSIVFTLLVIVQGLRREEVVAAMRGLVFERLVLLRV